MKVYISGKITGLPYEVVEKKFYAAEMALKKLNHNPINPLKNGLGQSESWEKHMLRDIDLLINCDAILMLDDWEDSKGARMERRIAEKCGITILTEDDIESYYLIIDKIIASIKFVTGLDLKDYSKAEKSRYLFSVRMIFTHQCRKYGVKLSVISKLINRDRSTLIYTINRYSDELIYNQEFSVMAGKVEDLMNKSILNPRKERDMTTIKECGF